MTTDADRLEKIVPFLDKELRAFCCRVIWTAILCRYVKLLTTFLTVALSTRPVNSTRGLRCLTRGCIVPTSKLKFHDYL